MVAGDRGGVELDPGVEGALGVDKERDLPMNEDGDDGEKDVEVEAEP